MKDTSATSSYPGFASASQQWEAVASHPGATILRLSVLRNFARQVHAERSGCMAKGLRAEAEQFANCEKNLEVIRDFSKLTENHLADEIQNIKPLAPEQRLRIPSPEVFELIDRDKLLRYDREWEAAIAAEAMRVHWSFWNFEAWVQITQAERGDKALSEKLWPEGIILFAESAGMTAHAGPINAGLWHGRWILVHNPAKKIPMETFEALPGIASDPEPFKIKKLKSRTEQA